MWKNPLSTIICYVYWSSLILNGYTRGSDLDQDEVAAWKAEVAVHFLFAGIYFPLIFLKEQQIKLQFDISIIVFIICFTSIAFVIVHFLIKRNYNQLESQFYGLSSENKILGSILVFIFILFVITLFGKCVSKYKRQSPGAAALLSAQRPQLLRPSPLLPAIDKRRLAQ